MRVVLAGGTGVIGRAAVRALVDAHHDVIVVTRQRANDAVVAGLGATPVAGDLFDVASLTPLYEGADAVVNLATHIPVGYAAARPGAWRRNDGLHTTGVANVVAAAQRAGVRRVVQESVSFVYADAGDEWITENSPIEITSATDPVAVAESHIQEYATGPRVGVILRFGSIIGDDAMTRFHLRAAAHGRPIGIGRPDGWAHLVHTDDLGSAVLAALRAPSGVYNVGAEPVHRAEIMAGYAASVGVDQVGFMGPLLRRMAGPRSEPLTRSLRVSSERFAAQTGWQPRHRVFGREWFDAARTLQEAQ